MSAGSVPSIIPDAGTTQFTYNGDMWLTAVTDQNGAATGLSYDPSGSPLTLTQPFTNQQSSTTTYTYDPDGNLSSEADPARSTLASPSVNDLTDGGTPQLVQPVTTHTYDGLDRVASVTAPGANDGPQTTLYCYYLAPTGGSDRAGSGESSCPADNGSGRLSVPEPQGAPSFEVAQRMLTINPDGDATATDYDAVGDELAATDPLGNETSYNYDELGDQTAAVRPKGNVSSPQSASYSDTSTYDLAGRLTQTEQGSDTSEVTTYGYDQTGNLTHVSVPGAGVAPGDSASPQVTEYTYNGRGLPWKTTTGSTATGTYSDVRTAVTETDGDGNVIRSVSPAGVRANSVSYYGYDGSYTTSGEGDDSQGLANIDATIRVYDQNNQLESLYLPWGCNLQAAKAPSECTVGLSQDSRRWRIDYGRTQDGMDELASVTQAYQWQNANGSQPATTYTYMPNGWLLSQTTPQLGDNTNTTGPSNGTQQVTGYGYDPAGDQISDTEQGTGPTASLMRASQRSWWPDGRAQEEDAQGNHTAVRSSVDDWTQTGQLQQVQFAATNSGGTLPGSGQENVCYDADGRVSVADKQVSNPSPSQFDTVFSYDRDGNVLARSDNGQLGTGTFACPTSLSQGEALPISGYSQGQTSAFAFDNLDRETAMSVSSNQGDDPQQPNRSYATGYWPSGAKESDTRSQAGGTAIIESWYFNDDGRESEDVRAPQTGHPSDTISQTFAYDTDGNRITSENGSHLYNALDQEVMWTRGGPYTAGSGAQVSSPGTIGYVHDGDGALLQQTTATDYANIPVMGSTVNESLQTTTRYCSTASAAALAPGTSASQAAAMPMCTQDDGRVENTQTTSSVTGNVTVSGVSTMLNIAPTTTTQVDCYDTLGELIEVVQPSDTCATIKPSAARTSGYGYNGYGEVSNQTVPYPTANSQNQTLTDAFGYDAFGRRDEKSETLTGQTTPTRSTYGYIGLSSTALGWEQGTTPSGNTFTDSYDYDTAGQPVGLYTTRNSSTTGNYYSYAADPNGTIAGLEGIDGKIAPDYEYHYTPYGELELGSNQTTKPLGGDTIASQLSQDAQANQILFEGFQYNPGGSPDPAVLSLAGYLTTPSLPDADSYTFPARNYIPGQAIYQSPDSFESAMAEQALETNPGTQNPYAYVGGNPTSLIETDGHMSVASSNGESEPIGCAEPPYTCPASASLGSPGGTLGSLEANTTPQATKSVDTVEALVGDALNYHSGAWKANLADVPKGDYVLAEGWLRGDAQAAADLGHLGGALQIQTAEGALRTSWERDTGDNGWGVPSWLSDAGQIALQFVPGADFLDDADLAANVASDSADAVDALEAARTACGLNSFSPSTKVVLADGRAVPIRDVHIGEKVLATNLRTTKTTAEPVTARWINHDTDLLDLTVDTSTGNTTIQTTQHHLFYDLTTHRWTQAVHLRPGNRLYTSDHKHANVAGARIVPGAADMWDLTVAHDHDFYVLTRTTKTLVHNNDCTTAPEGAASAIDQAASKVPDEWGPGQPARSEGGWRWSDPAEKPGTNYIRVDPGNPDSSDPVQQVDHVHVSSGGVQVANHLPLDQWLQWGSWNAP